jgi:hypothetical protein
MQTATAYTRESVSLDGEFFSDCEFKHCKMIYSGGEVPHFDNCRFEDCDWRFDGAAGRTLEILKIVWGAGAKARVQALIKEITGSGAR